MRDMKRNLLLAIALLLLVAAWASGCSGKPISDIAPDEPGAAPAQTEPSGGTRGTMPVRTAVPTVAPQREEATMTPTPARRATEVKPQDGAEQVVQLAREDLAQRRGFAPEGIRLVSVTAVQWRDASLGCPRPNTKYVQVITPGFKVVLEAEGRTYEYHTDAGRVVVLCEKGLPAYPLIPVKPGEIMDGDPWVPAD
jgi:hypothetical protein